MEYEDRGKGAGGVEVTQLKHSPEHTQEQFKPFCPTVCLLEKFFKHDFFPK